VLAAEWLEDELDLAEIGTADGGAPPPTTASLAVRMPTELRAGQMPVLNARSPDLVGYCRCIRFREAVAAAELGIDRPAARLVAEGRLAGNDLEAGVAVGQNKSDNEDAGLLDTPGAGLLD
jgi:hypothetical protein